jgi:hypothetical protein
MKLKLKIDRYTTTEELVALTALFIGLSGSRTTMPDTRRAGELGEIQTGPTIVFSPPADAAELNEPEGPVVVNATNIDPLAQGEAPKRRRRTKAEIEAEAEATRIAEAEAAAQVSNEAGLPVAQEEAGKADPAPTPTANATATETATQEPAASAPATESPSDGKTYTHADVQKLAVDAARRFGPEKVKALIAEYPHAAKIADLTATDLPGFVTKLNELS